MIKVGSGEEELVEKMNRNWDIMHRTEIRKTFSEWHDKLFIVCIKI